MEAWFDRVLGQPGRAALRRQRLFPPTPRDGANRRHRRSSVLNTERVTNRPESPQYRRWPATAVVAATAAAYALGAELAWGAFGGTLGFVFYPPSGVSLAALYL